MKSIIYILLSTAFVLSVLDKNVVSLRQLPTTLRVGAATAAYQVEGGWNASGKGESNWDHVTHTTDFVLDGTNADIASDSYNQHKRDVELLKEMGVDFYRFSLSWSRILPDGTISKINEDGIRYYNELINDLTAENITSTVTLHHFDLPQALQDIGGWENEIMIKYFADYARVVFEAFGDRVKTWLTYNEPFIVCRGYPEFTFLSPLVKVGASDYRCGHTILKAHAEVYHLYDRVYRPTQNGRISIALDSHWNEPYSDTPEDIKAAETSMQFNLGWFAHPIFSKEGDYPQIMIDIEKQYNMKQGYPESDLPEFTPEEIDYIRGSADFFGFNHYSTVIAKMPDEKHVISKMYYWEGINVYKFQDPSWPTSAANGLAVVPWGFRRILNWIKNEYNEPEIMVFENGFSDKGEIDDVDRVNFFHGYLNSMLDAIEDGVNLTCYTAWSLIDSFEYHTGYTERYGLHHVDFDDPKRPRVPKSSALFFRDLLKTRTIEESDVTPSKYRS